ncbi:MAG TPA: hypothetical protein VIX59_21150 [Candidatus Binataceae bacterium]
MIKAVTILICAMTIMLLSGVSASAAGRQIQIGVGVLGPISPQTETDIDRLVGALPNVKAVPIVPPGDLDAVVKRFVAGDPADKLDGIMVVSLPTDSFKTERGDKEAKFTGAYEIWTVNLSTLDEDRHRFTFNESEPVVGTAAAILTIPAQLFAERATGKKLLSTNEYQAYEAVQARVEAKLIAATRIYLGNASIRTIGELNPLDTAHSLLDRGDSETALVVFKSIGMNNPDVQRLVSSAQQQLHRADANALLGKTLGAIAGGNPRAAGTTLALYEKAPSYEAARAISIRKALAATEDHRADSAYDAVLRADVPGLDRSSFIAMLKQVFTEETGSLPSEIVVSSKGLTVEDKNAPDAMKTQLDSYAAALSKSAWLMSVKCGCDATASLISEPVGTALLKARAAPSLPRPQVGLP